MKPKTRFVCQQCSASTLKWQGQCPGCEEWNTLVEEIIPDKQTVFAKKRHTAKPLKLQALQQIQLEQHHRIPTHISELDRVLGGGMVPGGVTLIGGEPGIGKSTLLLQMALLVGKKESITYLSGEESLAQIKLRAERLPEYQTTNQLELATTADVDQITATLREQKPTVAIVDSIQTLNSQDLSGSAGSIGQVRECALRLTEVAKEQNIALFIVGHVTKEGEIAGPKVLEHMVDTVLSLQGDSLHHYRILRARKNRYGDVSEIGIFEMQSQGMVPIPDASGLFVQEGDNNSPGSSLCVASEGSRSLLIELQALTVKSFFGYPKRTALGFPINRLQLLIAVITRRAGLNLSEYDVYTSIVSGYQLQETSGDLAVCLAVASSFLDRPLPEKSLALGEVSLSGSIRPVLRIEERLREAQRLGLKRAFIPQANYDKMIRSGFPSLQLHPVRTLEELLQQQAFQAA